MTDPVSITIASLKVLEKLFDIVDEVVQLKQKAARLDKACQAWERAGWLKDQLIKKYESGQISSEKKKVAEDIHRHLVRLQDALKELRRQVQNNGGNDIERKIEDIKDLIDQIITLFVLM